MTPQNSPLPIQRKPQQEEKNIYIKLHFKKYFIKYPESGELKM